MRKQIDLSPDVKIRLEIMAAKSGTNLKKYIENILIEKSKEEKI